MATYTVIVYETADGGYYTEVPAFATGAEGETIETALAETRYPLGDNRRDDREW